MSAFNLKIVSKIIFLTILLGVLAIGSTESIYAAATRIGSSYSPAVVAVIGSNGTGPGQFMNPIGVEMDNDSIYVVDTGNNRVQILDLKGNYIEQIDTFPSTVSSFLDPTDVAVNAESVFISDSGNDRIVVFDHQGTYQFEFGELGSANGTFNNPSYLAINDQFLFVTDAGNDRVQVFHHNGSFAFTFGSKGIGDGQFTNPAGIDVTDDDIFVADADLGGTSRIQRFTMDGSFSYKSSTFIFLPNDLTIHDNRILVVDYFFHEVLMLSSSLSAIGYLSSIGQDPGYLYFPRAITNNGSHILISDSGNHRLQLFERNGPPVNVTLHQGLSSLTITWEPPINEYQFPVLSYRIYKGNESGQYSFLHETTDLLFTDHAVLPEQTYYYVITAMTKTGETRYSDRIGGDLPTTPVTTQTITETQTTTSDHTVTNELIAPVSLPSIGLIMIVQVIRKKHYTIT